MNQLSLAYLYSFFGNCSKWLINRSVHFSLMFPIFCSICKSTDSFKYSFTCFLFMLFILWIIAKQENYFVSFKTRYLGFFSGSSAISGQFVFLIRVLILPKPKFFKEKEGCSFFTKSII